MATEPGTSYGISKILPWVVLILASLGLLYLVQKGCGESRSKVSATESGDTVKNGGPDSRPDISTVRVTHELPGEKTLEVSAGSFSDRLVLNIQGKHAEQEVTARLPNCIPFDQVHFSAGTASFMTDAERQLSELLVILQAYPSVMISIEGHTSNEGDPKQNKTLSGQRADAIREWLEQKGIPSNRLMAAGWGDMQPFTSNHTEAGRIRNTRVEVCVVKK